MGLVPLVPSWLHVLGVLSDRSEFGPDGVRDRRLFEHRFVPWTDIRRVAPARGPGGSRVALTGADGAAAHILAASRGAFPGGRTHIRDHLDRIRAVAPAGVPVDPVEAADRPGGRRVGGPLARGGRTLAWMLALLVPPLGFLAVAAPQDAPWWPGNPAEARRLPDPCALTPPPSELTGGEPARGREARSRPARCVWSGPVIVTVEYRLYRWERDRHGSGRDRAHDVFRTRTRPAGGLWTPLPALGDEAAGTRYDTIVVRGANVLVEVTALAGPGIGEGVVENEFPDGEGAEDLADRTAHPTGPAPPPEVVRAAVERIAREAVARIEVE